MNITIESKSSGKVKDLIPDRILAKSYPCFTWAAIDRDLNLSLVLAPDPVFYDEDDVRSFLLSIIPYVDTLQLDVYMKLKSANHIVSRDPHWAFRIRNGKLFRENHGSNYVTSSCISE